jgi:uncharacterized protein (DUF302 family)|tara:strand:+ start:20761 stop:20955 length:195 start_codon:yes stop_codon:yes gene_type:complete
MTDDRSEDASYENEGGKVTITLKEYDKLRERQSYITDKSLISVIDKIEELVRALRKHIVRSDFD